MKKLHTVCVLVTQSRPTLCNPWTVTLQAPGSSDLGILQARTLEWITIPFSRGSSQPRNRMQVSRIAGRLFTICATRVVPERSKTTALLSEVKTVKRSVVTMSLGRLNRRIREDSFRSVKLFWYGNGRYMIFCICKTIEFYPMAQQVKNPPPMLETWGLIKPRVWSWVRKIPQRRKRNPLQYSCLKNPMDRGAWQASV